MTETIQERVARLVCDTNQSALRTGKIVLAEIYYRVIVSVRARLQPHSRT